MAQSAIDLTPRNRDLNLCSQAGARGRPHVILVIGSTVPGPRAMHSATWLGRRLGAEMLVVAAIEYAPPRDELVDARVALARRAVSGTTARLARGAVKADGIVVTVRDGEAPATIDDLADQHEAELVAVTSSRRSWLWLFAGSALGYRLIRAGRRAVLVIPDHRPGPWARFVAWLDLDRRGLSPQGTS